jgi:hypothetical protein
MPDKPSTQSDVSRRSSVFALSSRSGEWTPGPSMGIKRELTPEQVERLHDLRFEFLINRLLLQKNEELVNASTSIDRLKTPGNVGPPVFQQERWCMGLASPAEARARTWPGSSTQSRRGSFSPLTKPPTRTQSVPLEAVRK